MPTFSFARRIARRLRALWHLRELEFALKCTGLTSLDEREEWLSVPPSEDALRSRAIRNWLLSKLNPRKLVEEEIARRHFWRSVGAALGT